MTQLSLRTRKGVSLLLDAFESVTDLRPTHWGPDERARNAYERDEMISAVSGFSHDFRVPGLRRTKPPRYKAYFSANNEGLNDITVEFGPSLHSRDLKLFFLLGNALAERVAPEYGFVHLIWRLGDRSQEYNASGILSAGELQACGPKAPPSRTWYGPYFVRLIGRERLCTCGADIQETSWGGIQLDLVRDPWESDFDRLHAQQMSVMNNLQPSGIFGDYTKPLKCAPGPRWIPIKESEI